MWETAAATEHSTQSARASERRLAADGAAATEHSEESANAFERHTTAQSLPLHRWHCHGAACTATEHAVTAALPAATAAATATEQTEAAATRTATEHAQQAEDLMYTSLSVQITVESSVLAQLDRPTLDIVFKYLPMSPSQRGNEIACCNRACHFAWRRMVYPFLCSEITFVIENASARAHANSDNVIDQSLVLLLRDIADVLGVDV